MITNELIETKITDTVTPQMKSLGIHFAELIQYLYVQIAQCSWKKSEYTQIYEGHTMFLNWKTQHSKDVSFPLLNL